MIKVEPCKGCGSYVYRLDVTNLVVRCDPEPVDAQTAVAALLDGRELWRVTYLGRDLTRPTGLGSATSAVVGALRTAEPAERPHVVKEHRCLPGSRPPRTPPRPSVQSTPQSPPVGRTAPSSGPQGGPCSVPSAGLPRSRPSCDDCGQVCADGTYWGFQRGETWVYAQHVTCPA